MIRRLDIGFGVLAGVSVLAGVAGLVGPSALAENGATGPAVTVSVAPADARVIAAPCGMTWLDVTIVNHTTKARFVDVWVEPESPVRTSRDLLSTYVPASGEVTAPLRVSAPSDATQGAYDLTFDVGRVDEQPATVPVTVEQRPTGPDTNLAFASAASASSTHGNFAVCGAVDGNSDSADWSVSTGWNDGTRAVFPDWYAVEFDQTRQVDRVVLHTLNSATYPASGYGLRDWDVQVLDGAEWRTVDAVRANTVGTVTSTFDPVSTSSIRVLTSASNDSAYSRIVELEAYAE